MGYTNRNYNLIVEIAIAVTGNQDSSKTQKGDIIAARKQRGACGVKASQTVLWMQVRGMEENILLNLNQSHGENNVPLNPDEVLDKFRYYVPFSRLQNLFPEIDISRVEDVNDPYQPFMILDEDDYWFLDKQQVRDAEELIYDKKTGLLIGL